MQFEYTIFVSVLLAAAAILRIIIRQRTNGELLCNRVYMPERECLDISSFPFLFFFVKCTNLYNNNNLNVFPSHGLWMFRCSSQKKSEAKRRRRMHWEGGEGKPPSNTSVHCRWCLPVQKQLLRKYMCLCVINIGNDDDDDDDGNGGAEGYDVGATEW